MTRQVVMESLNDPGFPVGIPDGVNNSTRSNAGANTVDLVNFFT